jgi:carboxyl-terminal processing protease
MIGPWFQSIKKKALLLLLIPAGILSFAFVDDNLFEISKHLDIFATLFREVNIYYVDETDPEKLTKKAIDAMLESLDPYTEYFPEQNLEEYKMQYISSEYGGVGAMVQNRDGKIFISEPFEGFPAQKNDVRAGDRILQIDGKNVNEFPVEKVSELLKGQPGTKVKLLLDRPGETKPLEKNFNREEIKFGNISYYSMLDDKVGYIRLDKFLNNCYAEFRSAFLDLKRKNAESLIIDLRGNGGGILQEAVQIVNLFVPKGETIVVQKGKLKEMNTSYVATAEPLDLKIPICVLVDTATASASEITAGALQDLDRAIVLGQRTFGKGLVQQTKQLSYNSQLKVTVAKYYIPSGRCVQAINYGNKDKKGKADYFPDSLISEFKTKKGRLVYDGSGIYPDIKTELPIYSHILEQLIIKNVLFDYATEYRLKHPTIASAKDFRLTDKEYEAFTNYVKNIQFNYNTHTEEKLIEIKKAAEQEKYYEDVKKEFELLQEKMRHLTTEDMVRFKSDIQPLLENEIVSRYYFQKGRLENFFGYDDELSRAKQVLKNKTEYTSVLNGEGTFKSIGKPSKKKNSAN